VGSCEHGDKYSGSIKGGSFIGYLSDRQLLKNDCAPWRCYALMTCAR
jgi:hypothetical protein